MTATTPGTFTRTELRQGSTVLEDVLEGERELAEFGSSIADSERVYFVGCGSSLWTGRIVAAEFRKRGVDARAVQASAFLFSSFPVSDRTTFVALSQSGETSETVRAAERAIDRGARLGTISNTQGSTLADLADESYVTPAGTEHAILATKSVDAAVAAGYLLATGLTDGAPPGSGSDLKSAPAACRAVLDVDVAPAVELFDGADRAYAVGLGTYYGLAGEAATKLGEGPLVQTTALPGLEISHGPISNVGDVPVLVFPSASTGNRVFRELLGQLDEAGARTLVVHPEGTTFDADVGVAIPRGDETVLPALKFVQRLALDLSLARGLNPDRPPELTKRVVWENL